MRNKFWAGEIPSLSLIFLCNLKEGSVPRMLKNPDPYQTDIKWVQSHQLGSIELLPHIAPQIIQLADGKAPDRKLYSEPIDPAKAKTYIL